MMHSSKTRYNPRHGGKQLMARGRGGKSKGFTVRLQLRKASR